MLLQLAQATLPSTPTGGNGAMDQVVLAAVIAVSALIFGVVIGIFVYYFIMRLRGKAAQNLSEKIINDAKREAEHLLKDARYTAKGDAIKLKEEAEQEIKQRRKEQSNVERRLQQKEETLDRKTNQIDKKISTLEVKEKEIDSYKERLTEKEAEIHKTIQKQIDELERVASMDKATAQTMLLNKLQGEITQESGALMRQIIDETKEHAQKESQRILTNAMQRYAGECTYERTTATIPLPTDEMKGRIIGREGRNIRALEAATGVSILIDDTPEAVVISCFDPIRKEVARQVIERLISDGRIHPGRIEDLIKKIRKEVEESCSEAGEAAVLELGVQGIPSALIKILGRLKYRYSFSQNVLKHSIEAATFMGAIASELGLDVAKAKRIGLLHDIGKAIDHELEGSHAKIGADLLRKYNEAKDVINAVASHHEEEEGQTVYAPMLIACDALSASRPGARSESGELYLKRLEKLEEIGRAQKGVENCYAIQAGRELRVLVEPEKVSEEEALIIARNICNEVAQQITYSGQIKVTVIRETRSVEYAK